MRSGNRGGGAPAAPSPQAAAFLHETFEYADEGVLLGWSPAGSLWWPASELDDAAAAFVSHGAERDIWVGCGLRAQPSANGGRGKDRDVVGIPGLWADIDERPADVAPMLGRLVCPPSLLVASGHGVHAWWLLDEFWTFDNDDDRVEARTLLRRLHTLLRNQGRWKVDAVHDLARVMRVPGTMNHKQSPPSPVTLRKNGQPRRYAFSELDEWLPPGKPAPLPGGHKPPPAVDADDDEIDRLAASYAAGDERFAKTWARQRPEFGSASEYDLAVCVKGADMGCDDATCWALVRRWRQLHGEDPAKAERADYAAATLAKARAGEPPATRADTPGERAIVQSPPSLAENPRILNAFGAVIRRRGVVGEVAIARLLYLVLTTRLLDRQVSAVVKGHTSSGKSWTLDQVLQFFPPGAFLEITAMSEKALVYLEEEFAHRTIVVFEAVALREGVKDDMTAYLVRSLLSEGRIRYPVTVRGEDGNWTSRYIVRDGPTNLVLTTTQTRVHEENETRVLSLTTDDSREQTRRVMRELASESDADVDLSEWQQLQVWLEDAGERRVTIPYAPVLAELIPPIAVRLRRDFGAVLALIRAHAILHQCFRARDADGRVVASLGDYDAVRDLVAGVLAEGVGSTVSVTTRGTVAAVAELETAHEDGVPTPVVAARLNLDNSAAWRRLHAAADRGFVVNREERPRRPGRWAIGEPLPDDVELLPQSDDPELRVSAGQADDCTIARSSERKGQG